MRHRIHPILFVLTVLSLLILPGAAKAANEAKQVLYLNSYQSGYGWSDNILDGIRSTLDKSKYAVDLQVEYMDAKKYPGERNRQIIKTLFESKFRHTRFDAIICSDNDAFQFLLAYHEELFPDVPVVFCGVNDLKPEMLTAQRNFTGVVEELDITYNLNMALQLNPGKRHVYVISDESLSSTAIAQQVRDVEPDFRNRLQFHYWDNVPLEELLTRSGHLPEDSLLFYIPFYVEAHGKFLSADQIVEKLFENSNVPIYGAWRFLLGHGIVGGRLLDGRNQGMVAASMAISILDGNPIPPVRGSTNDPNPPEFDWRVLKRFNLVDSALLKNASFINLPKLTYNLDKKVVWTVALALLFLLLLTLITAASRNRAVRAERELAVSRKMLRSIIDTIPQLIYWKDLKSRYVGANRQFADFFGFASPEEVVGKVNKDFVNAELFSEGGERLDQEVVTSNRPMLHEVVTYDGEGHENTVFEISKIPLHNDNGSITGVLTTAEDITDRVQLEQQLLQSQKLEAVGTFVGGIAHDFNNVLTTVINSTELALFDAEGEMAKDMRRAKSAAEHGSHLVSQILNYARPSNRGAILIDPADSVNDALTMIEHRLPSSIRLIRDVDPRIGRGMADPSHLAQIVMNLCTNALQAMRQTGGKITVSMTVGSDHQSGERTLILTVRDTGPGIPREIVGRVFDPFFTTKDRQEGTGLGLAIVHGVVNSHGGTIRLNSVPGETRFDISIPFAHGPEESHTVDLQGVDGNEHILFVEDDTDQLNVIPRTLARLGYNVTPARGGQQALSLVTEGEQFDILVTDFNMPGFNGVELARTIRQLHPGLPVVLVSGGREAQEAAEREPGIAKIVLKPYTGTTLAAAIRQIFNEQVTE